MAQTKIKTKMIDTPMVNDGDMSYFDNGDQVNLPIGTEGQSLVIQGGVPEWQFVAATPSGAVTMFAGAAAPSGYLLCNGAEISRTTYSALFAAIGTTYGVGDGSTTFNIPNLQGIFPASAGTQVIGGVTYARTLGTVQNDTLQGHGHNLYVGNTSSAFDHLSGYNQLATANNSGGKILKTTAGGDQDLIQNAQTLSGFGTARTSSETNPANLALNFIIKT